MGVRLYERELSDCLDFCSKVFNATSPEEHERLRRNKDISPEFVDLSTPVLPDMSSIETNPELLKTKDAFEKINSRRVLHREYTTSSFESEDFGGYRVRLEKGNLGLSSVAPVSALA